MTEGGGVSSGNQQPKNSVIRRPCKDLVIDKTVTSLIFDEDFRGVPVVDKRSEKQYKIERSLQKEGLHMM